VTAKQIAEKRYVVKLSDEERERLNMLVHRVAHIAGYNRFSFMRALSVVKCQSAVTCFLLRLFSQAATSSARVSLSGIRRSRH
jgi:hypothetical protein